MTSPPPTGAGNPSGELHPATVEAARERVRRYLVELQKRGGMNLIDSDPTASTGLYAADLLILVTATTPRRP